MPHRSHWRGAALQRLDDHRQEARPLDPFSGPRCHREGLSGLEPAHCPLPRSLLLDGSDATLVTCGAMRRVALAAAEASSANIEVIDLLTLWPWDRKTVMESVARTGRLVTLEEAPPGSGWGGEVAATIATEAFGSLKAPPHRITLPEAPVPYSGVLEARFLPSPAYVAEQVSALVSTNKPPLPWWRKAA